MYKFKSLLSSVYKTPRVGYWYKDSDTGKEFRGEDHSSFEELERHVQKYREQNGYDPIENFRECWEHFICSNSSVDRRNCCPLEEHIGRNFKQYLSGGYVYIKSLFQKEKEKFVSLEEAQERASKCFNCSYNRKNYGHSFAQYYTDKMMRASVGDRHVDGWQSLYTCKGCSCILNSKIWYSKEIVGTSLLRDDIAKLKVASSNEGKPISCWQLECKKYVDEKRENGKE